jgi:hypothetical protein
MRGPILPDFISTFKDTIADNQLLGTFVLNTKADVMKRNTVACIAEEKLARGFAESAAATLSKLNDGLRVVATEIAHIDTQELPDVRNSEMASALTESLEAIDKLSLKTNARTVRREFLKETLSCGYKVLRPTVNLANMKALAGWATAQAEVAACIALESAGESYAAGAAVRNAEGRGELFPRGGKTAQLLAEARRLFEIANTYWIGYHDEERRLQKEQR